MARRVKDKSPRARFHRLVRNPSQDPKVHRTVITVTGSLNATTAANATSRTIADVRSANDYTTFAGLYKTYRVVGMEFQFFDLQPGTPCYAVIGTNHTGGTLPSVTAGFVQDCPDATNVVPYRSHYLHWIANTPFEKLFFDNTQATNVNDFGGFFVVTDALPSGSSTVLSKWRYLVRAVVEFKDRV